MSPTIMTALVMWTLVFYTSTLLVLPHKFSVFKTSKLVKKINTQLKKLKGKMLAHLFLKPHLEQQKFKNYPYVSIWTSCLSWMPMPSSSFI